MGLFKKNGRTKKCFLCLKKKDELYEITQPISFVATREVCIDCLLSIDKGGYNVDEAATHKRRHSENE